MKKIKLNHLIAAIFFILTIAFITLAMTNTDFFDWAFSRHQNQLSWYIRPIFLIPFCFFAYKKNWAGMTGTIFALFTSMIWFPQPEVVAENVREFLQYEKNYLYGEWDFKKIIMTLAIPVSFLLLGISFWKRNKFWGMGVMVLMMTGKIVWSIQNAGESGSSIIVPALVGLLICIGLIIYGFKKIEQKKD